MMISVQFNAFLFLIISCSFFTADIVKKTTKDAKNIQDVDVYYKYRVENIPLHWDQYWIETKSAIPIPAGRSNFTVELPFSFNFYGHPISKIFIFPSGYISTSLAEDHNTKYIAPLKAGLDPHHDKSSGLSYWIDSRNNSITVEWNNAIVKDLPSRVPFSFRAKIWSSGLIEFTYKYLGIDLAHLLPFDKDFKIGIGDSVNSFGMVFEYHSVEIPRKMIQDKTMVTLQPLATCINKSYCDECVEANVDFHCFWCPSIKKCLSGIDFHRPEFQSENCPKADSKSVCKPKHKFIPDEDFKITKSSKNNSETSTESKIRSNDSPEPKLKNIPVETQNKTLSNDTNFNISTEGTFVNASSSTEVTNLPLPTIYNLPPTTEKHYLYYDITLVLDEKEAKKLWVDMEDTTSGRVKSSSTSASVSKKQAHTLKLPFPFPFFGNMKTQISFTGDGFISTMNSWMIHDKTHFIAPLKGLFDHQFSAMTASVNYKATSRSLTVQWDTTKYFNSSNYAPFVFQAKLHSTGDIDFVYKQLGQMEKSDKEFIGLSEGYSEEMRLGFLLMPKSNPIKYFEYHNVNLTDMKLHLTNWTAIRIRALPTCSNQKNCGDCLSMPEISGFKCGWCTTANLCRGSNEAPGEDWIVRNCYSNMVHNKDQCPKATAKLLTFHDFEDLKPDDHKYYKSVVLKSTDAWERYFKDFSKLNSTLVTDMWKTSNNFQTADPYTLSFMFPYYGHPVKNIMILTGGFISLASSFSKRNLLEHEYIAPLMADLDASYSKLAKIQIYEQDTAITISWRKMKIVSKPELDSLSFQLTLMSNGTIVFCYEDIPLGNIDTILSSDLDIIHPVKIGLSDSFVYDSKKAFTNKTTTTLYKYHDLDLKSQAPHIKSKTAILLEPLQTCNLFSSCSKCLRADSKLNCVWCPGLQFCSDGMDRKRQKWDAQRCYLKNHGMRSVEQCPLEILRERKKYYNQTFYEQSKSILGDYHSRVFESLEINSFQDPNYFYINLPFQLNYFEEAINSIIISSHGVLGISNQKIKEDPSSEPVMYKYIAPFKGNLKFGKDGAILHGELWTHGVQCYGVEWVNAEAYENGVISFQSLLCKNGTIFFQYSSVDPFTILELGDLGVEIGLWHGLIKDEFVDMAVEEVGIPLLTQYLLSGLVIRFNPFNLCTLTNSCLHSPECSHYVSVHGCSRLSCQEPSDPPGFCPRHEEVHGLANHQKTAGEGVALLGVVGGILLILMLLGVLVYGVKRLDGRPGHWQTVLSIFQPGYHIFRSGMDIGSTEVLNEEGRGTEEIHL